MTTIISEFAQTQAPESLNEAETRLGDVYETLSTIQQKMSEEIKYQLSVDFQREFKLLNREVLNLKMQIKKLLEMSFNKEGEMIDEAIYLEHQAIGCSAGVKNFLKKYC